MGNNLMILHQHSLKYIAYSFVAFVVLLMLDLELLSLVAFIFMAFSAYVFRNPEKLFLSHEQNSVTFPVDGTIISVEEIKDSEYAYKVDVKSSYFDISFLRTPFDAKVTSLNIVRGARLSADSKLYDNLNEYAELLFIDKNDNKMRVIHKLTRSFAPLFIDVSTDDEVMKSARYGAMLSGITSIYLPHSFKLNATVGNKVSASETLLGFYAS